MSGIIRLRTLALFGGLTLSGLIVGIPAAALLLSSAAVGFPPQDAETIAEALAVVVCSFVLMLFALFTPIGIEIDGDRLAIHYVWKTGLISKEQVQNVVFRNGLVKYIAISHSGAKRPVVLSSFDRDLEQVADWFRKRGEPSAHR